MALLCLPLNCQMVPLALFCLRLGPDPGITCYAAEQLQSDPDMLLSAVVLIEFVPATFFAMAKMRRIGHAHQAPFLPWP